MSFSGFGEASAIVKNYEIVSMKKKKGRKKRIRTVCPLSCFCETHYFHWPLNINRWNFYFKSIIKRNSFIFTMVFTETVFQCFSHWLFVVLWTIIWTKSRKKWKRKKKTKRKKNHFDCEKHLLNFSFRTCQHPINFWFFSPRSQSNQLWYVATVW